MRAHLFLDADLFGQVLADLSDAGWIHGRARLLPRKQPVRWLPPAPVVAQESQQFGREHDLPGPLAFACPHQNQHPLAVGVGNLEMERFTIPTARDWTISRMRTMPGRSRSLALSPASTITSRSSTSWTVAMARIFSTCASSETPRSACLSVLTLT